MPPFRLPIMGACALAAVSLAPAAWAQALTPKDAWEGLNAFVTGAGLQLRSAGLVREGESMIAREVVLSSGDAPAAFAMTFPEVRMTPTDGAVAIVPSANFGMELMGAGDATRQFQFTHDGGMTFTLSEQAIGLGLGFPTMLVEQTGGQRSGRPLDEALRVDLANLVGQFTVTLESPVALEGTMSAARMDYILRMNDDEFMPIRQNATSQTEDLSLSVSMAGLDQFTVEGADPTLAQAFANGFAASLELLSGRSTSTVAQTFDATQFAMSLTAAESRLGAALADGRFDFDSGVTGMEVQGESEGVAGSGTIAAITMAAAAPVVMMPEDDEFMLHLAVADLELDRALLDMIGAGEFGDDTVTFDATVTGLGRWLVEITEDPQPIDMPVVFTSVALPQFLARLGPSMLTGSGTFAFTPGTFGRGDVPDGTGDFVFELTGGELALNRLTAAGLLPPDQQFMTRMMMNAFGRATGPDALRSEIAIRPGNQITVNGAPLPF